MLRRISVFLRRRKQRRKEKSLLQTFEAWKNKQAFLQQHYSAKKKLLIIRLDDIGDYLLFRNTISFYKKSERWKNYHITFLGNVVWKELFEQFDETCVDAALWINKKKYLSAENYRIEVWKNLHQKNFEVIICPSRTRPLLLDDLCMLACKAAIKIASANKSEPEKLNKISDALYTELFKSESLFEHEFIFNLEFGNWCCAMHEKLSHPEISLQNNSTEKEKYIVCFIGASAQSKRWPAMRWNELIKNIELKKNLKIFIAGSKDDFQNAEKIIQQTNAENIAGKFSLAEMANFVSCAQAVICCDSMGLHLSAALNIPTVVLANGNNDYRFTNYQGIGIENVKTLYPKRFLKKYLQNGNDVFKKYTAVSSDIATIKAAEVFEALHTFIL